VANFKHCPGIFLGSVKKTM